MNILKKISKEHIAWFVIFVVVFLVGIVRIELLDIPLERDEGEYAYAGQLILKGMLPYKDIYNMKYPGIYVAYAIIIFIFGENNQSIHFGLLVINAMTIILIFLLGKRLIGLVGAIVAAIAFAILSLGQYVQGVWANAEHFVIFFITAAMLMMLRGVEKSEFLNLFLAGLFFGLGFSMKQHGVAFFIFAMLYIFYYSFKNRVFQWQKFLYWSVCLASGFLLIIITIFFFMIWAGIFENFWFWTVKYATAYISQVSWNEAAKNFIVSFVSILSSTYILWMFVIFGFFLILLSVKTSKDNRMFLFMYGIFSIVAICPGFYFRPHYFILLLPFVSLSVGLTVKWFSESLRNFFLEKSHQELTCRNAIMAGGLAGMGIFFIVGFFQPIYNEYDFLFNWTNFQRCRSVYGINSFNESLVIADFINTHTNMNDRIAVLGSEPQIFFYSKRHSVSPYIYMYPFMEKHSFALKMQKEFIRDVELNDPKYVVFINSPRGWFPENFKQQDILRWINDYINRDNMRLICVIELQKNNSLYHWGHNIKWPVNYKYYMAIFKRKT